MPSRRRPSAKLVHFGRNLGYSPTGDELPKDSYSPDDEDAMFLPLQEAGFEMSVKELADPDLEREKRERQRQQIEGPPTTLYRFFDEEGRLLYVGVSTSAPNRMKQHRATKPWFTQVASATFSHLPTRNAALEAEAVAIRTEKPLMNVVTPLIWKEVPRELTAEQRDSFGKQTRRYFDMDLDVFLEAWREGEIDRDDDRLRYLANFLSMVGSTTQIPIDLTRGV